MKIRKDTSNGSDAFALLDRNKCFGIVAAAVKNAVSDSVVDLKSPEVKMLLSFHLFTNIILSPDISVLVPTLSPNSFQFLLSCFRFLEYPMGRWWLRSQFFHKI